ncbi:MAG: sigma-70 family RNA polymerase sigma factor [Planctomycetes bacterium]|nr:sigma-70 family RNA polymerase sigma factor [Planctomycetota bacterium]
MDIKETHTSQSLFQWSQGDGKGLEALLERHLPWLQNHVRKNLGPILRRKGETQDYVQDAVLEFLLYAPSVMISDEAHFRALLVRIVKNSLCDKHDWYAAKRRWIARERPLPTDTVLLLDPPKDGQTTPSRHAQHHEEEAWVRLGMDILEPEDRELLVLRQWEKQSFTEIGKRLGIKSDAARMRHNSAMGKLGEKIFMLRQGQLAAALQ